MASDTSETEMPANPLLGEPCGSLIGYLPDIGAAAQGKIKISFCSHRHSLPSFFPLYLIQPLISSTFGTFPAVLTTPSITNAGVDITP